MKLNKILMALSAMAIVGCSSEDFNDPSATQAINDSRLIQLDENFVLAGVGEVDNTMRTHWEQAGGSLVNVFLPIYVSPAPAAATQLDAASQLDKQAVGLCWLGNGGVGTDVYTNYEFYHFGWLNNDEPTANVECDKLTNGAFYSDLELVAAGTANAEAAAANFKYTVASGKVGTPADDLNFNSGVYKTENKAIFGGKYIVYYPYDKNFKDAGTIPAAAKTSFDWDVSDDTYEAPKLGDATFRYSAPVEIKGGDKAADFGLKNLSTLVRLRVSTVTGDASIGKTVDKIILYSESGKLLKQANLAADKIAAGKEGDELYAETEGTKTITTNISASTPADAKLGVKAVGYKLSAYITVLPTTVDDLVVLVHNSTDGTWAAIDMDEIEFKAGAAQVLDVIVKAADFKSDFIAVDQASLETALTEANPLATSAANAQTITVIGDITLNSDLAIDNVAPLSLTNSANITIKGDDIIVPEDVTLTLNTKMESNVRVLGKSCCTGAAGGILNIAGGTINNVTMEPTEAKVNNQLDYDTYNPQITYSGAATVAAGKTVNVKAGNVFVNQAVQHKGDIVIAEGAKVTVNAAGDLKFVVSGDSQILNDGTIEVIGGGKFDITNISGTTTANDGKKMTNNGKFIHNVNAEVGTTVQSMNQNGEYRCKVANQNQLDDAYLQWTACNIIEMVNGAYTYNMVNAVDANKHNGNYIDIEVNSTGLTTFNNPTDTNVGDELDIQVGNLTVTAGGLDVVFVGTAGAKKQRTLTVNGDMTVAAATTLTSSKGIVVKENLTVVEGAAATTLTYKAANGGLAVTKDITVSGNATFDASTEADALNITCANFYLTKVGANGGTAKFGNRTASTSKNLEVSGTISNPEGCTFNILAASGSNLYAWVTCTKLIEGGTFSAARPRVIE